MVATVEDFRHPSEAGGRVDPVWCETCLSVATGCGMALALLGALVLVGWAADLSLLRSVAQHAATQPLPAVGLIVCAVVVLAVRGRPGLALVGAAIVGGLGALALWQHAAGISLAIDTLLFHDAVVKQPSTFPGRMVQLSAVEFILFAISTLCLTLRRGQTAFWVVGTVGLFLAAAGGMGYLLGAQRLSAVGTGAAMSVPTTAGFILAFLGLLLSRPRWGWVRLLIVPTLGGTALRRLLPVGVGLPLLVGAVVHWGLSPDRVQPGFRMAIAMLLVMAVLCLIVGWFAKRLDAVDAERARMVARHRAVLDTAADAMVVINRQREILAFNRAAESIFGYNANEVLGRKFDALMPTAELASFGCLVDEGDPGSLPKVLCRERESQGYRRNGAVFPLELSLTAWSEGDGFLMTVIMRDITVRKQAVEALRNSEERYRTIFDQAAVGIEQVTLDGGVLEVNRRLCDLLGYSPDELRKMSFRDYSHPQHLAEEDLLIQGVLCGERPHYVIEKEYLRKDGQTVWVRVTSSIPRGQPDYRISLVEDISDQRRTLKELEETKTRLELALEGARAGLWDWNVQTQEVTWSPELYEQLGIDVTEPPTTEKWLQAICPDDHEAIKATTRRTLERREPKYYFEYRVQHPLKGIRWLLGFGQTSFAPDGTPLRVVGITIDATELKMAEEEAKRARDAAEQASRAKSAFLAAASHDLRQPVQAMILLNTVLTDRLRGHPTEKVVARLDASVNAMSTLLEGLLDVSRLDAGVVEANSVDTPIGPILDLMASEYTIRAADKELDFDVLPNEGWIHTDPALFERILRNLIENAIRYTPAGGRILLGCRRHGSSLGIGVYDTGIGIPEDKHAMIFEEFFQCGNPERDREKGLGLGLSIVQRLSQLLGHSVSVRSEPGRGSVFTVEVRTVRSQSLPAAPEPSQVGCGGSHVLVIDDEAMVRRSISLILADWGCRVSTACDAGQAVELVRKGHRPDVIIADYRLREGRSGINAAKEVELACGRPIPTIVLTGDTDPQRIAEVQRSGYRIAHKPIRPEKLKELVLVEKSAVRSA